MTVVHGESGAAGKSGSGSGAGTEPDAWLAERFQEQRGRLRAVAYRMLGSLEEADDAVQEACVRCSAAGADEVVNLGGWLTTIVSRVCLNTLRARAARPESLAGPRVPDPVLTEADGPTPEQEALLADSVGLALLVVLDTLAPAERVAFVLHDVFDVPFAEIGPMLARSTDATRQLASRARRRVRAVGPTEPDGAIAAQRAVVDAFFTAARAGDLTTLVGLLDPEVVLRTDGFVAGPRVPDPVLSPADGPTPEQEALLADSVGLALLVVLDTLAPAERVAFVLHDVFDVPFAEIGAMLGRSTDATRQLASRARRRVRAAGATEPDAAVAAQRAVVDAFFAAARAGDLTTLVGLLDPEVVLRTDGFVRGPAVLRGAATVANAVASGASPRAEFHPVLVNGVAGMLITLNGRPAGLMAFTIVNGRITAVDGITDPRRVRKLVG